MLSFQDWKFNTNFLNKNFDIYTRKFQMIKLFY